MAVSTNMLGLERRIDSALDARALALVTGDAADLRAELMQTLYRRYSVHPDYAPALIETPTGGSDAALLRLIAKGVGLIPKRMRYDSWRDFHQYVATQYTAGRRVLLLFDNAQLMTSAELRLLHALSTICIKDDLAVQVVIAGETRLARRLQQERWKALWSRLWVRARLSAPSSRQAA